MEHKKLVDKIARKLGRDRKDVAKLLDAFTQVVANRCGDLDTIAIPGFGSFEPKKKNERIMTNPSTGKRMLIPPKIVLNFKVSNVLKSKLNKQ
ncbi:MAG: HU family DNA-binding protein [Muribaculaceae bacterium]|nr:HU family DNA-binding protein [Muribaculaceae bacterium]